MTNLTREALAGMALGDSVLTQHNDGSLGVTTRVKSGFQVVGIEKEPGALIVTIVGGAGRARWALAHRIIAALGREGLIALESSKLAERKKALVLTLVTTAANQPSAIAFALAEVFS